MYLHQVTIYCWWNQIDMESRNNIQVAVAGLAPLTGRTDDLTGLIWRSQSSSFRTYRSDRWRTYLVKTGNICNTTVVHGLTGECGYIGRVLDFAHSLVRLKFGTQQATESSTGYGDATSATFWTRYLCDALDTCLRGTLDNLSLLRIGHPISAMVAPTYRRDGLDTTECRLYDCLDTL